MEIFNRVLKVAIDGGASDIHIKIGAPIIVRIDGQLIPIEAPKPTSEWMSRVLDNIVPKHLNERLEKEREIDFSYYAEGLGRFRTNLFQQKGSFCLAMRYVKTDIPSFEELGLLPKLKEISMEPRGIVIVSGTTGCGKSTTLAAMLQQINSSVAKHIITLEDPIEFVFTDNQSVIEQREIGLDSLSFPAGLKHILRQDPDVIMIGEMRDSISFSAAMSVADTGHLVLSTLHTTNASQSITRVLDFFQPEERDQIRRQLASTLKAVICQRMVSKVKGGVIPAIEIMINTPTVRKLIEENRLDKLAAAIETGVEDGMQNFNQALFQLVKDRVVSESEALSKATNAKALEMNFQGIFLDEGKRILS
ncbi:MAG: Twitching mobility protein [Verrucomicrobia subdivision 3 bacterium]|nr:Twitching mobility protein [Limisphaerales bacterium]MCS1415491.1 Twitching mobility protein [Limisphaerales bacterium]